MVLINNQITNKFDSLYKIGLNLYIRKFNFYIYNFIKINCKLIKQIFKYVISSLNIVLIFRRNKNNDLIKYSYLDFIGLKN